MEESLNALNKKRQLLINQLGETKLKEILVAMDNMVVSFEIQPYHLEDVANYYRLVKLLPNVQQKG